MYKNRQQKQIVIETDYIDLMSKKQDDYDPRLQHRHPVNESCISLGNQSEQVPYIQHWCCNS